MTGAIPKYGKNFRLENWRQGVEYVPGLASRRYVLKTRESVFIRSTNDSEHWTIFVAGPAGASFPSGGPFDTLTEAMPEAIALGARLAATDPDFTPYAI